MEREFIVLCGEHYNPLGIIRSLGEAGIKPIAIVKKNEFQLTSKSKYIKIQLTLTQSAELQGWLPLL